jgi:hypothetical protein
MTRVERGYGSKRSLREAAFIQSVSIRLQDAHLIELKPLVSCAKPGVGILWLGYANSATVRSIPG